MLEHNTWSGRINYIHDDGHERGREWFTVTTHQEGYRVVRAMCEMDDSQILRDVTFTLADDFKPVETYVRLVKAGKYKGSAWFTFEGDEAKCESWMTDLGRVSQKITVAGGVASFGPHPVLCDCFHTALYDHSNPLKIQPVERILH